MLEELEEMTANEESDATSGDDQVHLRIWLILALGRLWFHNDEARWYGARHGVHTILLTSHLSSSNTSPEVRAATVFALGTFINNYPSPDSPSKASAEEQGLKVGSFINCLVNRSLD